MNTSASTPVAKTFGLGVRFSLLLAFLAAGTVGQFALLRHLEAAGETTPVPLKVPLDKLPLQLGDWHGQDRPIEEELQFGDAHVYRRYVDPKREQELVLWAVYSQSGEDRRHHPEVCMAVAGLPEDTSVRQTYPVPGHPQPVQQYRFGTVGTSQWVFYWHYTLGSAGQDRQLSSLQRLYHGFRHLPSSVTLEVFAPESTSQSVAGAREFVRLIDAALQPHLPPHSTRGSRRMPVTVIDRPAGRSE